MPSRRAFLALGLVGGAAAMVVGLSPPLRDSDREVATLNALCDALFYAPGAGFPRPSEHLAGVHAHGYLAHLGPAARVQVRGLLRLVEWAPLARFGQPFSALGPDARLLTIDRIAALPRGALMVAALKQLCALGTLRHPSTWSAMGYDGPTIGGRAWATPEPRLPPP